MRLARKPTAREFHIPCEVLAVWGHMAQGPLLVWVRTGGWHVPGNEVRERILGGEEPVHSQRPGEVPSSHQRNAHGGWTPWSVGVREGL